jgi:hypothetical protein
LLLSRALHTFNVCFRLPQIVSQLSVLVDNGLQLDITCSTMLFEISHKLFDLELQAFAILL